MTDMIGKIKNSYKSGFTLIEMIVVVGIFGIITAITIYNYGKFNSSTLLTNLAYEVALEVRQAQVYSLGVRSSGAVVGADLDHESFENRFGTYFNIADTQKGFLTFSDKNPGGIWGSCNDDGGAYCTVLSCNTNNEECLSAVSFSSGVEVSELCVSPEGVDPVDLDAGVCSSSNSVSSVEKVGITFSRPNPEALIKTEDDSDADEVEPDRNVGIIIEAKNGAKRAIIVRSTGQITVEYINN